jgi:hypothetical protein
MHQKHLESVFKSRALSLEQSESGRKFLALGTATAKAYSPIWVRVLGTNRCGAANDRILQPVLLGRGNEARYLNSAVARTS